MGMSLTGKRCLIPAVLAALIFIQPVPASARVESNPESLLPTLPGWVQSEDAQSYLPETLFEYINGAAESYLGYDFQELAVGHFQRENASGSLTVEIYDMGLPRNAFGIYSTERYPESRFLPVGDQGYVEEGLLNFLVGRYYVKLMCYDCGPDTESVLQSAGRGVAKKAGVAGGFPPVLSAFPRKGLVANSEKFVLKNFMGQSYLEAGYTALYRREGAEFECFIIEARSGEEAEAMLRRLTDQARAAALPGWEAAFRWRDRYLGNMFAVREGRFLCGLMRVPEGMTDAVPDDMAEIVRGLKPAER